MFGVPCHGSGRDMAKDLVSDLVGACGRIKGGDSPEPYVGPATVLD